MRISAEVHAPSGVDVGRSLTKLYKGVAATNDSAYLRGNKVNPKFIVHYAKYYYIFYRLFLRIKMGKSLRDKFLKNNNISYVNFLPEWLFAEKICRLNDLRAIPRKHTDDFYVLFIEREKDLKKHLTLNENEVFVDVGANVGSYSLQIAKQYKSKGVLIFAIEAHPETFTALRRNVDLNGFANIRTVNKAVSDHRGVSYIYEHLSDGQLGHVYTGQFSITARSSDDTSSKPIGCDTLDNILHGYNCNVMKMDIEGAEVIALRGADNVLKQLRKIIVEIHDENLFEVESILKEYHFKLEIVGTGTIKHIIGSKINDSRI